MHVHVHVHVCMCMEWRVLAVPCRAWSHLAHPPSTYPADVDVGDIHVPCPLRADEMGEMMMVWEGMCAWASRRIGTPFAVGPADAVCVWVGGRVRIGRYIRHSAWPARVWGGG